MRAADGSVVIRGGDPPRPPRSAALGRISYRLFGVVFVAVMALFAGLAVALYNKAFTPIVLVTLDAKRAGLQLLPQSDVKVRGLIVGDVRAIKVTAAGAALTLALDPSKTRLIPANVEARLLPKTLFGEKYVDLVIPPHPSARHIAAGDVIPQDRSRPAVEIDQLLNDVLPVLQALNPPELNAALGAIATALQGRGAEIGDTVRVADAYLRKINPQLPTLTHDIAALSDVASTYNQAAPDLLRILRDASFTSNTIVEKRTTIISLLSKGTTTIRDARRFVAANENHFVGFNIADRQALALLARYSPEVPCLVAALVKLEPRLEEAVGGRNPDLNLTIEIAKPRPPYQPGLDNPAYTDQRAPRCYGLPNPQVPASEYQILDGTQDDKWYQGGPLAGQRTGTGILGAPLIPNGSRGVPAPGGSRTNSGAAGSGASGSRQSAAAGTAFGVGAAWPASPQAAGAGRGGAAFLASAAATSSGSAAAPQADGGLTGLPAIFGPGAIAGDAGSAAEKQMINILVAPLLGERSSRIPDLATLLVGPLMRGQVVTAG
jgi:phospholipid/cholesterol/gamma-HCH transport system substrate-binding protein